MYIPSNKIKNKSDIMEKHAFFPVVQVCTCLSGYTHRFFFQAWEANLRISFMGHLILLIGIIGIIFVGQ